MKVEQCTGSFLALGGLNSARLLESDAGNSLTYKDDMSKSKTLSKSFKSCVSFGICFRCFVFRYVFWGTSFGVTHIDSQIYQFP